MPTTFTSPRSLRITRGTEAAPGFRVLDAAVVLGPSTVRFDSIRSLSLRTWQYLRRNSLFGSIPVRVFEIRLGFEDRKELVYRLDEENLPEGVAFSPRDFDGFDEQYKALLERTFGCRIDPYLEELGAHGYFTIGELKFYPKQKLVRRKRVILFDEIDILHQDRNLWIRNKVPAVRGLFTFNLLLDRDPDVWLELMRLFQGT